MADSTLVLTYDDLLLEVCFYLGFGRDSAKWAADDEALADAYVQSGYRQFLYPPPLDRKAKAHVWSFLHPTAAITLAADEEDFDLPDTFGSLDGDYFWYEAGTGWAPVPVVGVGQILTARSRSVQSGEPRIAAIRPKLSTGSTPQRFELLVYPKNSTERDWAYSYNVQVDKLVTTEHPVGGLEHNETILESCLAVAEGRSNNEAAVHQDSFMRLLAASIVRDQQTRGPKLLGYNADPSTGRGMKVTGDHHVTYKGVLY